MTNTLDLQSLRQAAEAATPGPWRTGSFVGRCEKGSHSDRHPGLMGDDPCVYKDYFFDGGSTIAAQTEMVVTTCYDGLEIKVEDANYIAAANPAVIIALLDERDALLDRLERAEAPPSQLEDDAWYALQEAVSFFRKAAWERDADTMMNCQLEVFAAARNFASRSPAGAAVPESWKLVPKSPTAEMLVAGAESEDRDFGIVIDNCYRAMIAAAPAAPSQQPQVPEGLRSVIEAHCADLTVCAAELRRARVCLATADEIDVAATELRAALAAAPSAPTEAAPAQGLPAAPDCDCAMFGKDCKSIPPAAAPSEPRNPVLFVRQSDLDDLRPTQSIVATSCAEGAWNVPLYLATPPAQDAGTGDDLVATVRAHCNDLSDCAAILDEDGRFKNTATEIRVAVAELRRAIANSGRTE